MLQEHLAWLDREIAALGGTKPSPLPPPEGVPAAFTPPAPRAPVTFTPPLLRPPSPAATELATAKAAEEIMARYQTETHSVQTKTKLGCFLYFFFALGLVAVVVLIFYLRTLHRS